MSRSARRFSVATWRSRWSPPCWSRGPGDGFAHRLGGLLGAGQRRAEAHRPRLRARPRDVAVRRARGCRKGLTHKQILAFYYPGTTLGNVAGTIRVLITADTDNDVRVLPASGLRVRVAGSATSYALPRHCEDDDLAAADVSGKTILDYDNGALAHLPSRRQGPAVPQSSTGPGP